MRHPLSRSHLLSAATSRIPVVMGLALATLSAGCGDPMSTVGPKVVERYAAMVSDSYQDTVLATQALDSAIQALVDSPSADALTAAQAAWREARSVYSQTEAYRFYGGPIDSAETGPEGFINAWPLDEAYIDYVEGNPSAGVINDPETYPELSYDVLLGLNERGGETNISTGYHAIEFLLWGQDFSTTTAGNRSYEDYLVGSENGAPNADRRGTYLKLVSSLLLQHLTEVASAWSADSENGYRAQFEADDVASSIQKILVGLGSLSGAELAGERLYTAYESRDQEDEHSCFSDNTLQDIYHDAIGIQNVWLGTWHNTSGTGLKALVEAVDPDIAAQLDAQIATTLSSIQAIPEPFDAQLTLSDDAPGRKAILTAVESLEAQTNLFVEAATRLGLSIKIGT